MFPVLALLFSLSGASALVYQVLATAEILTGVTAVLSAVRFAMAFDVLIVPTALMGAD